MRRDLLLPALACVLHVIFAFISAGATTGSAGGAAINAVCGVVWLTVFIRRIRRAPIY